MLLGFMVIGGFLLLSEHRAHLLGVLPWLLLAACPLLHLFMHQGHDDHEAHGDSEAPTHMHNDNKSGGGHAT